ncbi:MAG: hypothetical protein ACRD44_04255, partial [Bryobacteraceae bacterium]
MSVSRILGLTFATALLTEAQPVRVELFENVLAGSEFEIRDRQPAERYSEPAYGFVRTPIRYSSSAIPLDRSVPFVLRAAYERTLPAGPHNFRLRARGAAVLWVNGSQVLSTKPQKPNKSGDDPVPPPVVRDNSPLRPAAYPHQDATATLDLGAGTHRFELIAIIGGKGLY